MVGAGFSLIVALLLLCSVFNPLTLQVHAQDAQQAAIDPDALEALKEMSDALQSAKEFSFDAEITNDNILDTGETIQISGTLTAAVKRPNQVYAKYTGDVNTREVWYNGDQLTLFMPGDNFYGKLKTPGTIDATMDFLIDNYDFSLPLADIMSSDPYTSVMETTTEGFVVGNSMVRGKECTHLAFRAKYVDWQIWISNDDPALPYKLVINYKELEGVPQYQAIFSNWSLDPKLSASVFKPEIPKGAVKIDFIDFKKEQGEEK